MKQPVIIISEALAERFEQDLSQLANCRVLKLSSETHLMPISSKEVLAGLWCTKDQWASVLSGGFVPHSLLCVELTYDRGQETPSSRWPLEVELGEELRVKDEHQYRRLIDLQAAQLHSLLLAQSTSSEDCNPQENDGMQLAFDQSEILCLELVAPLRTLSKRLMSHSDEERLLCQRLLERVENERRDLKELRIQHGIQNLTRVELQNESLSQYSLNQMVRETLKSLSAPSSWFKEGDCSLEALIDEDMTRRGLTLLISQLSLIDSSPCLKLYYDKTTHTGMIELSVSNSNARSGESESGAQSHFREDLAYVGELATLQGGQLGIESTQGGELKITWRFEDVTMIETIERSSLVQDHGHQSLIWLIDDEPGVLLTVKRWLTHAGYQVKTFEEGSVLLNELDSGIHVPSLIVCDADMPHMTGLEVLTRVAQLKPEVKRLLYTAREPNRWVIEAFNQGVVHRFIDKSEGPKTLISCLEEMLQAERTQSAQLKALDELLKNEQITLHLQPLFSSDQKRIEAVEALMRSEHPAFRGPLDILNATQAAEREFDLQRTLTSLSRKIREELPQEIKLFMNIDPVVFGHPDRLDEVFSEVYPFSTSIVLELTERGQLCGDAWVESVSYLRAKGFEIALDDLGAGYNSLGAVAAVSPEIIKLDISLVSNLHLSNPKREMVRLLSEYALKHQIKTVAEGIELEEEALVCTDLGIKWLQGYHLARPMPFDKLRNDYPDYF